MKSKAKTTTPRIFDTNKRIRLGIWGLGRGMNFYSICASCNVDVVAGCDYNEHMRDWFLKHNPGAFVTADVDEFLKQDIDAVLLATYCPAHADDAIKCLRAGKHVLSEVTAFHTMAEGVRLVEAVEASGKVYNLAENYPFSPAIRYLARKWREGLFGELMYAEFEYVHECRSLAYTYIDGKPLQPGNRVHNWRSWLQFHYYCTHSLGPVMVITGERPTRVVALPAKQTLAGYLMTNEEGMGGVTPSLINMSNGAVVRNLMGSTTNDTHVQRLWGTLGAAELNVGRELALRLGGSGSSPKFEVKADMDELDKLAAASGHGGGDLWMVYNFARQILTGEPAPFDIYAASDVTIPGILAYRSSTEGGKPYDVPDFRNKKERNAWRSDNWDQKRYDPKSVFPASCKAAITQQFSKTMADLIRHATNYRAYADWGKVAHNLAQPADYLAVVERLATGYDELRATYAMARKIVRACPGTDGARVLAEMLALGEEKTAMSPAFKKALMRRYAALKRKQQ
ncbi:MAG: Gfo/Idh/MocA family oxidoreductase [Verrucomicrobiota bacterium]